MSQRFSTYQQAVDFLLAAVDYEKKAAFKYSGATFDLERVRRFLAAVGNPQQDYKIVHITGTKGKGSTAAMTASALRAAGFKTGLFTSPHLVHLEERIAVDAEPMRREDTLELINAIADYVEAERRRDFWDSPTFFEMLTAMGLLHFSRVGADFAVVEVGLGGRLDSTNIVDAAACAITSIGFDHTDKLGETLREIAGEKAGIIKSPAPVATAVDQPEALQVIRERCAAFSARLYEAGRDVHAEVLGPEPGAPPRMRVALRSRRRGRFETSLRLLGRHQARNAAVVLGLLDALEETGALPPLSSETIAQGLSEACLPGRAQILDRRPRVLLDGAHTVESVRALRETIREFIPHDRLLLVFGVAADKNVDGILREIVPHAAEVVFTQASSPRAADAAELAERAKASCGKTAEAIPSPLAALVRAEALAGPNDLIAVVGSFYLAGDILKALDA